MNTGDYRKIGPNRDEVLKIEALHTKNNRKSDQGSKITRPA